MGSVYSYTTMLFEFGKYTDFEQPKKTIKTLLKKIFKKKFVISKTLLTFVIIIKDKKILKT
jgi:hypothetical protein